MSAFDPHRLSKIFRSVLADGHVSERDKETYTQAVDALVEFERVLVRYEEDRINADNWVWKSYHEHAIAGLLAGDHRHLTAIAQDGNGIVLGAASIADKALEVWNSRFKRPEAA